MILCFLLRSWTFIFDSFNLSFFLNSYLNVEHYCPQWTISDFKWFLILKIMTFEFKIPQFNTAMPNNHACKVFKVIGKYFILASLP